MNSIKLKKEAIKKIDLRRPLQETPKQAIWARLVLSNVAVLQEEVVANLPGGVVKQSVESLFEPIEEVVLVLSDSNPDNKEQVNQVLKDYLNDDLARLLDNYSIELVQQINDQVVKNMVKLFVVPTVETLRAMSDDNPANEAQLKEVWVENFVKDKESQAAFFNGVIVPFVEKVGKNSKFGRFASMALDFISLIVFGRT
jgi:hypothetical protein